MTRVTRNWLLGLTALVIIGGNTSCGITAPSRDAGYASFDAPTYPGIKRDTSISLGPTLLRLVARHADEDPQVKALLKTLNGLRVSVYEIQDGAGRNDLLTDIARITTELGNESWQPIVQVSESDQTVRVLLKQRDSIIEGIAVLVVDDSEFLFVNVMGDIAPEMLAQIADEFPGGDALASLRLN